MDQHGIYLLLYCACIMAASVFGGMIPMVVRLTHRRMQFAITIVAGFMLGIGLLHLLPHALFSIEIHEAVRWMIAGLLAMFFLERFFSFHHHTAPGDPGKPPVTTDPEPEIACDEPGDPIDHHHGHGQPCGHDHGHADHDHCHTPQHKLSWTGITLGLVIHSLLGGAALAAAMQIDGYAGHGAETVLPGLAVFLVIVLHKPFDAMTLLTLMSSAGWPRHLQHVVNAAFALAVPAGALLFMLGIGRLDDHNNAAIGCALAAAAGIFLCVSLTDLLPEVHFHTHDRGKLSVALLLGLGLAWVIASAESRLHDHDHSGHGHHPAHVGPEQDGHQGHDHSDHEGHDHGKHNDHDHDSHQGHDDHDHGSGETHAPHTSPVKPDPHAGHDHSGHDHDHHGHAPH